MDSPAKAALVYLWAPFANVLWYVETILMGTISLLVWPFDRNGEMQHACARWWCRMVAVTVGARIHVHGLEQVQAGRSYVYVANHSSLIDTPALFASLPYQFKIMAKRSLFPTAVLMPPPRDRARPAPAARRAWRASHG